MRGVITAVGLALLAGTAVAADPAKGDAELIRGAWKVVSAKEATGRDEAADVGKYVGSTWTFGDKAIQIAKEKSKSKVSYKLDPSKKPCEIDLRWWLDFSDTLGIYKLEGDKLTICYVILNQRPAKFDLAGSVLKQLIVLERVKADDPRRSEGDASGVTNATRPVARGDRACRRVRVWVNTRRSQ